jgi:thiamine-monophosphate kinase
MDAREAEKNWPASCRCHLRPVPLAHAGAALSEFAIQNDLGDRIGLMDVSDGLARDLPRLLGSVRTGLGAELFLGRDMLHGEVLRFCTARGLDPSLFAYVGGEDYALAGTCPAEAWTGMEQWMEACGHHVTRLGTVRPGGVKLNGAWAEEAGFDHFS